MEELNHILEQLTSGDDEAAEKAVAGLVQHGEAAVETLLTRLQDFTGSAPENVDARWWILRALAELPGPRTRSVLIDALKKDEEASLRQCAALGLRKHPDSEAIPALIGSLQDPDALCRTLGADSLVAIGEEAVPALIAVLESGPEGGQQEARLEAVRALAELGDKRAIPILFQVLQEDSVILEYWASQGLERMGLGLDFFKP